MPPQTPQKSGQEFTRIIDTLNDQFSLDIPNPRYFSPGANKSLLEKSAWRCHNGLKRLYYSKTLPVGNSGLGEGLNGVLNNFEEWVCSRNAGDAVKLLASREHVSAGKEKGAGSARGMILTREREERMAYLLSLVDDELYLLNKGAVPAVKRESREREEDKSHNRKRRFSTDDDSPDEFMTAPNSPEKISDGASMGSEESHKGKSTRQKIDGASFVDRLTGADKSVRYDAVDAAKNKANYSFTTFATDSADYAETSRGQLDTSFNTVTFATEVTSSGSTYDDSVVAHMLSEDATLPFTLTGSSLEPARYSADGEIMAELLQNGPFSLEHSLPGSIPLLYRYELERIGRAWNVSALNNILAGDSISLRYDEFWKWVESVGRKRGKSVPEKPTRKAWDAARGNFTTGRPSEVVVLTGELDWCSESEPGVLKLKLNPLKTERSCRFHRRFGSDRFLSLTIPAPARPPAHLRIPEQPALLRESIALWLTQNAHECLGRTWKAFFVEEVKQKRKIKAEPKFRVDFFAIDGIDFVGRFSRPLNDSSHWISARNENAHSHTPMDLGSLLEWHLSVKANVGQTNLKLFQRMSLALSKTFATVVLKPNQVLHLHDNPDHRVMNDGCALMSRQLANQICDILGITGNTPSAFQGRIAGAKGLWMVDRHQSELSAEDDVWIQISDSQLKIKPHPREWQEPVDDDKLTFEVVKWSKPPHPVDLNIQLLAILDHGGHVKEYIADLARMGIQAVARDFEDVLKANSPVLCRSLAQKIRPASDASGGLMLQSMRRLEQWMTDDVEAIVRFSEAGFAPRDFYPLRKRLGRCLQSMLERYVEELRIEVPLSTYAFCIADPYGVLKEDEVHFGLSNNWRDDHSQFEDNLLDGIDVLVGRLPAHLPSDIQRRKAVWKPELRHFKDVIVFPTTGDIPLADILSGGDYDGDTPWICWDQNIVRNFYNSQPPSGIEDYPPEYFGLTKHSVSMRDIESIGEFLDSSFTFNLMLSNLGRCTVEHERLSYDESIDSRNAKELSFLLSHLVDGRKAGVQLSEKAWQNYRKKISPIVRELPAYKSTTGRKPRRSNIIDYIRFDVSHKAREDVLANLEKAFPREEHSESRDPDLVQPWNEAKGKLLVMLESQLREVDELQHMWNRSLRGGDSSFSSQAVESAEQARLIPPPSGDHPMIHVWQHSKTAWLELLASYAYSKRPRSSFVLHAFGEQLCQIKSRSHPSRTVTHEILACYRVNKKVVARLQAQDDAEEEEYEDAYEGHEAIEAMLYRGAGGYYDPDDMMSVE
ncbi:RNA dependent RNA polymerase-domain-containing protein [Aspergillus unguis]